MGIFDFFKPKKKPIDEVFRKMMNSTFPKSDKDINAATNELLHILNDHISREEAKVIVIKSVVISRISNEFTKERLKQHLAGYCLHHFKDDQVDKFHGYLTSLAIAMMIHRKTPSEVRREGDNYVW
jgi:hypothetical protein